VDKTVLVQPLRRNVKRFRGGLVLKAHRLLCHSTLGSRVIEKKKKSVLVGCLFGRESRTQHYTQSFKRAVKTLSLFLDATRYKRPFFGCDWVQTFFLDATGYKRFSLDATRYTLDLLSGRSRVYGIGCRV